MRPAVADDHDRGTRRPSIAVEPPDRQVRLGELHRVERRKRETDDFRAGDVTDRALLDPRDDAVSVIEQGWILEIGGDVQ